MSDEKKEQLTQEKTQECKNLLNQVRELFNYALSPQKKILKSYRQANPNIEKLCKKIKQLKYDIRSSKLKIEKNPSESTNLVTLQHLKKELDNLQIETVLFVEYTTNE